ncbi:MAG: transposase [Pseudonocardia sp.]|nr:transposase [Pseudonocardia sp.]
MKARIVAETLEPGAQVSDVARRHGVQPQQVTAWRRLARQGRLVVPADGDVVFATLAVEAPEPPIERTASIEIEAEGVVVRLSADASAERIGAIVRSVRAP